MQLTAQIREKLGKSVRELREKGLIPAELYGKGVENLHLAVPVKELKKVFKQAGESMLIDLTIDGKVHKVMMSDLTAHFLSEELEHVDFHAVRLDEKIRVKVPFEYIGESAGVKAVGGILVKAIQDVEIEALPADIPRAFTVDLVMLSDIGKSVQVGDLKIPASIRVLVNPKTVIATITAQAAEEEAPVTEVKLDEVKVETEEKKKERDAKKEETAKTEAPTKK